MPTDPLLGQSGCPYCGSATCVCAADGSRDHEYIDADGDFDDACSHCAGDGCCMDGADPLGDCPDEPHRCHACHGSGRAKDQVIW